VIAGITLDISAPAACRKHNETAMPHFAVDPARHFGGTIGCRAQFVQLAALSVQL